MQHGSVMGVQNLNAGSGEMAKRIERLWRQSWVECEGARRFYPDLYVGGKLGALVRKRGEKKTEGPPKKDEAKMGHQRKDSVKTPVGSGDTAAGRGRVRFEVGTRGDGGDEGEGDDEGVDDLLRRMWEGGEVGGGGE